jgi:transposase
MIETLETENQKLKSENENYQSIITHLKDRVESLELQLVTMKREKFGRKSERVIDDGHMQKSMLPLLFGEEQNVFNEAEITVGDESVPSKDEIEIKSFKRKKPRKKHLSELLIDEVRINDLPGEEKICPTHKIPLRQVGETSCIKLEIIPESRKVIKVVTPLYGACSDFCAEEDKLQDSYDILPHTAATPNLLSHLITYKYDYAMPFYRMERLWGRLDIEITRATMARWTIEVAKKSQALINLMEEDLMLQGYFQSDETHVNVLTQNGERLKSKSYIWVRYAPVIPIVLYEFHPTRSGEVPKNFLEDYEGYIQVDGYSGYNVVSSMKNVKHVCCWQHARKYFFIAYKDEGSIKAYEMLKLIKKLFKVDEEAFELKLDSTDRKFLREEKSKPLLDEIKMWLETHRDLVRPTSALGVAIRYILERWDKLIRFLEDGRLELSTNFVENKIRPFTVGRKNWLFFETDKGAESGCIHYSLIETAKANGKDPQKYLEYVYTELPRCKTIEDLEKLLPYDRPALKARFNLM